MWLNVNRLALNIKKTHFVVFRTPNKKLCQNITLKFGKKAISQRKSVKYLGLTIDEHINWKEHISNICKKVGRSIGIMYRLRKYMGPQLLVNIYYSLIYSHLIYGIEVWGSACVTSIHKILILQKKVARLITNNDNF